MPHQCVRCGKVIDDGSKELLSGCSQCGSHFFFYVKKKEQGVSAEVIRSALSEKDVVEMERDVRHLMGVKQSDKPVILDLETIKAVGPGKFSIDVSALLRGEPVVINISDGKYFIDLASAFKGDGSSQLLKHLK